MTKKDKAFHITMLIIMILELIFIPFSIMLFYWFILVPEFGFSYWSLIPMVWAVATITLFAFGQLKQRILRNFKILLKDKIKEMEKDDGRED